MKYLFILLFILTIAIGGYFTWSNLSNAGLLPFTSGCKLQKTVVMEMKDDEYSPKNIVIPTCSKVIFKNISNSDKWPASDLHPTHGIYPEFDPQENIPPGEEWSFIFEKPGNWRYHDHLIPSIRGVISVN